MKVSVNWLKQFLDFELPPTDELVQKIGAQLGAVEEVVDLGAKYQDIVVAKVVSCEKHPDADKLSICQIDAGRNDLIQVVCGAPNVREGMLAAWLPPGVTVPSTIGKDPLTLEARDIRGEKSNGMLASAKELGIGDSHEGLVVIDKDVTPGTSFAKAYRVEGEMVIDIENKMFTHRPDCFGVIGVTREIAGIQQKPFKSPEWYVPNPEFPKAEGEELKLSVTNELPELVPRFTAVAMSDIKVEPSPIWLQIVLSEVNIRPINNIVDYSNFWMLETGQPIHVYDYDKVKSLSSDGAKLVIRNPKPDEKIKLLNGKTIEPRTEAMMVATDKQLICLGGAMGGTETEVDTSTKNIIIEAANWDMFNMRRTSMEHGIFTDAVTRFTKGQSPLQNLAVVAKIVESIRDNASGKVASQVIDDNHVNKAVLQRNSLHEPVKVSVDFINARLGLELSADEMKKLLENVEFKVDLKDSELTVTAPFWRTDIELREDIVEEIGRLYGYDHLPLTLPKRDLTPARKNPLLELKSKIRTQLAKAGANEVLTYSFVHGNLLDKVGQDKSQAFQISNALSPDLQYYRLSLTPSLLEKIHPNIKAGYDEFALFELGNAHVMGEDDHENPNVPKEVNALGFVYAAKGSQARAPYYIAKKYLTDLLSDSQLWKAVSLEPLENADLYKNPWVEQMTAPFEPRRSAVLRDNEGLIWGVVGEFKSSVRKSLKLSSSVAGFEIDPLLLTGNDHQQTQSYVSLPRFPKVTQDITLKVSANLGYQELYDFVSGELSKAQPKNTLPRLSPVDIFQRQEDKDHKHVTFHLEIASYDRTLTDAEVNKLLDTVAAAAKTKLGAERI